MSKTCTFCGGKGKIAVNTSTVDLLIAQIIHVHFDAPCPHCHGKGVILTEPAEIVEEFLGNLKRAK